MCKLSSVSYAKHFDKLFRFFRAYISRDSKSILFRQIIESLLSFWETKSDSVLHEKIQVTLMNNLKDSHTLLERPMTSKDLEILFSKSRLDLGEFFITDSITRWLGHADRLVDLILAHRLNLVGVLPSIIASEVSNASLFNKYFSKYLPYHRVDSFTNFVLTRLNKGKEISVDYILLENQKFKSRDFHNFVVQAAEKQNLPSVFSVREEDLELLLGFKKMNGMGSGDWFVTFHDRASTSYDFERNVSFESYIPAIEEVIARGGWVVRMGAFDVSRVNYTNPNFINYAESGQRNDQLDVALLATSRFHLGSSSGVAEIPRMFGRPVLWTNVTNLHDHFVKPGSLMLPQKIKRLERSDSRCVAGHEDCDPLFLSPSDLKFEILTLRCEWVKNSPSEILDGVREILSGVKQESSYQEMVYRRFQEHGIDSLTRVCNSSQIFS